MSEPEPSQRRRISIFRSPSGLWYFHIQGDNYQVIAPSEGYTEKRDMLKTLATYFPEWEIVEQETKTFKGEPMP